MDGVNVEIAGFLYESGEILSKKDMQEIGAGHYELMADRGFDGGVEKLVRLKDFDAALAREAALREELAQSRILAADQALNLKRVKREFESMRDRKNSIVDLQQRLTAAEQRNAELVELLDACRGELYRHTVSTKCCLDPVSGGPSLRLIDELLIKPTESGASE